MDCLFVVIIAIYILELVDDNHLEFLHRLKQKYCDKRRRYLMIYREGTIRTVSKAFQWNK